MTASLFVLKQAEEEILNSINTELFAMNHAKNKTEFKEHKKEYQDLKLKLEDIEYWIKFIEKSLEKRI